MLKNQIKNNLIYAFGSVANSASLLLLIPFLVKALDPTDYGLWSIYEVVILLVISFITLGMDIGLMREYAFYEEEERAELSGTVLISITSWGILLLGFLTLLYIFLIRIDALDNFVLEFKPRSLINAYFICFFEAILAVSLAIFRMREQPIPYVILSVGRMVLFVTGAIVGVISFGGVNGALLGRLFSSASMAILSLFWIRNRISLKFHRQHFRKILSYGLPLLPANISSYVLLSSDRYIIGLFTNLEAVAIYSFAYKLASSLDILITRPFATDWAARRFHISMCDNAAKKYADVLLGYLLITTLGILIILSVAPAVYHLIAPVSYSYGLKILPILLIGVQVYGLNYPLNIGLVLKDRTPLIAGIGIVSAIFCLLVEFWLIPRIGIAGGAWSTLLSYFFWTGAITYYSNKVYPVTYNASKIIAIIAAGLVGYSGLYWIQELLQDRLLLSMVIAVIWCLLLFSFVSFVLFKRTIREFFRIKDAIA